MTFADVSSVALDAEWRVRRVAIFFEALFVVEYHHDDVTLNLIDHPAQFDGNIFLDLLTLCFSGHIYHPQNVTSSITPQCEAPAGRITSHSSRESSHHRS